MASRSFADQDDVLRCRRRRRHAVLVAASALLGLVHGKVRGLKECGRASAVDGPDRHTDRGADGDRGALEHELGIEAADEVSGELSGGAPGSKVGEKNGELVTPEVPPFRASRPRR